MYLFSKSFRNVKFRNKNLKNKQLSQYCQNIKKVNASEIEV